MIKYYGTPITSEDKIILHQALTGRNGLVSFANQQDIKDCFKICNNVILDNGAFSTWKQKKGKLKKIDWVKHWDNYYKWVEKYSKRELYFIPDVIGGSEADNDALLKDNPFADGVPVWHIAESLDRLERLASDYDYIAFGSSGEYSELGTYEWHKRMNEAMKKVCDSNGVPLLKIHMLRCLEPKIFTQYPFYSGDSSSLGRNHSRDGWREILLRIEKYDSPDRYEFKTYLKSGCVYDNTLLLKLKKNGLFGA